MFFTILLSFIGSALVWYGGILNSNARFGKYNVSAAHALAVTGLLIILLANLISGLSEDSYREHTESLLTGGDSFVYLDFQQTDRRSTSFPVRHVGQYPVYDVKIDLQNVQTHMGTNNALLRSVRRQTPDFPAYTKDSNRSLPNIYLPEEENAEYTIHIHSRNKTILQLMQILFHEGRWIPAYRVYDLGDNSAILYEFVGDGFPVNESGEIPWFTFSRDSKNSITYVLPDYEYLRLDSTQ